MAEQITHSALLVLWFLLAIVVFCRLLRSPAPCGTYTGDPHGAAIGTTWGWVVMDSPTILVVGALFGGGPHNDAPSVYALLALWMAHYLQRTLLRPFLRRDLDRRVPLVIVGSGFLFDTLNAYLNGRWVFGLGGGYPRGWLADPRLTFGSALFVAGYAISRYSDYVLARLRCGGNTEYAVPRG